MKRVPMTFRLSLGLASLAVSVLCLLHSIGLLPDTTSAVLQGRKSLCEAIAIYCSTAALHDDQKLIESTTRAIVARNPDIESAVVRLEDGRVLVAVGEVGNTTVGGPPSASEARVPIHLNERRWGTVEVRFRSGGAVRELLFLANPAVRFLVVSATTLFLANLAYLTFIFRRDPSVRPDNLPQRVRATLDTLVEGVLLLDRENRVALVNASFAKTLGRSVSEIEGRPAAELGWTAREGRPDMDALPWDDTRAETRPSQGDIVALRTEASGLRTLSVNATPIVGDDGTCRGVLATFDDMTEIERKNIQLRKLLDKLKRSRAEVKQQNQKLRDLATTDPLTSCLNRRAFFERFEATWNAAERHLDPLSCVMLDIDHFKSVNDRYGHAVGDQAIQMVSGVLRSMVRSSDLVCRYGGEEFCVLLPQTGEAEAVNAAERFRKTIAERTFAGISVTASFGVASRAMGADDPHALVNQADEALYAAKRSGRNRVVRRDQVPPELLEKPSGKPPEAAPAPPSPTPAREVTIPYHAVTSLITALAHRDPATAEHSRRVANLCLIAAKGLLTEHESYVLEIGALLHDIGKLGIPDAILKKPAALTEDEWRVMRAHDGMGVEIIAAAFSCDSLSELIRTHHAWFGGNPRSPDLPTGEAIPLGARLLSIADAFDAMVSDRVYRKGRGRDEAFLELRRCAGRQFDPTLVDHFIEVLLAHNSGREAALKPLTKHEALRIGLIIETLADALDARDAEGLCATASKLRATAVECDESSIANLAARLEELSSRKADWFQLLELTGDLLELCRSTQATYLATFNEAEYEPEPGPPAIPDEPGLELALASLAS